MTAAERLLSLAGQTGTAAALLLLIGTGATAGAALADCSGLATGPAGQHLLADKAEAEDTLHQGGPDRQVVDRITRPANWTPWDADADIFVRPHAPRMPPCNTEVTPSTRPPGTVVANAAPHVEHLARLAQQDVNLLKKQAEEVFANRQQEAMALALALVLALDEDDDD